MMHCLDGIDVLPNCLVAYIFRVHDLRQRFLPSWPQLWVMAKTRIMPKQLLQEAHAAQVTSSETLLPQIY